MDIKKRVEAVDRATLTRLVRSATGNRSIEINTWSAQQIYTGAGEAGLGIYRVLGTGRDATEPVDWSLILKVLAPTALSASSGWNYWQREIDAYRSGLLSQLLDGLAVPRCLSIDEQPDGSVWLWLEVIAEEDTHWPLARYGLAARHLGRFNGAYLTGLPFPAYAWLSRDWLRGWVEENAAAVTQLSRSLDHPWVQRVYPPAVAAALLQTWAERETFLRALARLPQTLCHLDAFRRNLFGRRRADGRDETVVIDWAFVGQGALGEELVPLILASIAFLEAELDTAQELEEQVFAGYIEGLRDAGWRGDPKLVRLGYAAAAALRYGVGALRLVLPTLLDANQHPVIEQRMGRPMSEIAEIWIELGHRFTLRLTDEARELLSSLG